MKITGRTLWIIATIGIFLVIISLFFAGKKYLYPSLLSKLLKSQTDAIVLKYEEKLKEQEKINIELNKKLTGIREDYAFLMKKLKEKAKQREFIKPPQSDEELKQRFKDAGYPPTTCHSERSEMK